MVEKKSYRNTLQQLVFIIGNNGKGCERGRNFLLVKGTTWTISEKCNFGKVEMGARGELVQL